MLALWPTGFGCVALHVGKEISTLVVESCRFSRISQMIYSRLGLEWQTDAKAFSGFFFLSWLYILDCKKARYSLFSYSLPFYELLGLKSNIFQKRFVWLKEAAPWGQCCIILCDWLILIFLHPRHRDGKDWCWQGQHSASWKSGENAGPSNPPRWPLGWRLFWEEVQHHLRCVGFGDYSKGLL